MSKLVRPSAPVALLRLALEDAEDRQRKLNELCVFALRDFVGRHMTPYLIAEAEVIVRQELDAAVKAGTYILPDGLRLSRVELGPDSRLKVFFEKVRPNVVVLEAAPPAQQRVKDFNDRFEAISSELMDTDDKGDD